VVLMGGTLTSSVVTGSPASTTLRGVESSYRFQIFTVGTLLGPEGAAISPSDHHRTAARFAELAVQCGQDRSLARTAPLAYAARMRPGLPVP
jgi:hypothetical protein